MGHQRISTGNIHHDVGFLLGLAGTLCVGDCLSRPVAGVLVHTGQSVEDRAFAYVWVSSQGNHLVAWRLSLNNQSGINGFDSHRAVCKAHSDTPGLQCVNQDISAIFGTDCDYGPPDQKSRWVVSRASAQTFHIRIFNQPNIQQAAPHAPGGLQRDDGGVLTGLYIIQTDLLIHNRYTFRII
jgi:hypothetical protein